MSDFSEFSVRVPLVGFAGAVGLVGLALFASSTYAQIWEIQRRDRALVESIEMRDRFFEAGYRIESSQSGLSIEILATCARAPGDGECEPVPHVPFRVLVKASPG